MNINICITKFPHAMMPAQENFLLVEQHKKQSYLINGSKIHEVASGIDIVGNQQQFLTRVFTLDTTK